MVNNKHSTQDIKLIADKLANELREANEELNYGQAVIIDEVQKKIIAEPFNRITQQNHHLIAEMKNADFDGFIRLDPTLNQAITHIHLVNEIIVSFPQGSFPIHIAYPMVYSTMHLLSACEKRYGREKVKPMRQAFCKLFRLWFYTGAPRHPQELYAKKLFIGEDNLIDAICKHNQGIVEKPRRSQRNPRKGSGLHGTRTKCMRQQLRDFQKFLATHPISDFGQDQTTNARARLFWANNYKHFERAADATGEKRGYANSAKLASAYRASKS